MGNAQFEGLAGWLILVGISLCLAAVRAGTDLTKIVGVVVDLRRWNALTVPGEPSYHPIYGPLLIGELTWGIVREILLLLAILLFFAKRRAFPRLMNALIIGNFVFVFVDLVAIRQAQGASTNEHANLSVAIAASFACLVWLAYFAVSKRVRATFIR